MKEMKDQWTIDVLLFNKQLGQLDIILIIKSRRKETI